MRYHWGLAIGHLYTYESSTLHDRDGITDFLSQLEDGKDLETEPANGDINEEEVSAAADGHVHAAEDLDDGDESGSDNDSDEALAEGCDDDEEQLLEMDDMYGDIQDLEVYE